MQVFGQHYPVVNMKRVARPHRAHDAAQKIDLPCERVIAAPLRQIDGKEISSACMPGATIVGHVAVLQRLTYGAMRCAYCALQRYET